MVFAVLRHYIWENIEAEFCRSVGIIPVTDVLKKLS